MIVKENNITSKPGWTIAIKIVPFRHFKMLFYLCKIQMGSVAPQTFCANAKHYKEFKWPSPKICQSIMVAQTFP